MSSNNLTKQELAVAVYEKMQMTKHDAALVVDEVFRVLQQALVEGRVVSVTGFGKFTVKKQKARQGRNPKTGAPVQVPAKSIVLFRASNLLKDEVNR